MSQLKFLLLLSITLCCISFMAIASEPESPEKITIACVDAEHIIAYFSQKFDLNKKIMQEYTDYLESMPRLRLTTTQKNILAENHLDHITSKYISVIISSMTQATNKLIAKHKITILTHKTLFDLKNTLFNTTKARKSLSQDKQSNNYLQACDEFFKRTIIAGPSEIKDITNEVLLAIEADLNSKNFSEFSAKTAGGN